MTRLRATLSSWATMCCNEFVGHEPVGTLHLFSRSAEQFPLEGRNRRSYWFMTNTFLVTDPLRYDDMKRYLCPAHGQRPAAALVYL